MTGASGMRPAPGPDQPPIPVRLVTFNTHHGVGDDERHDLPRLAKLLASTDADVICLQEVDRYFGGRSEDVDQALLLSRALDMQLAWGPAIDEPRHGREPKQYGNALLSRLPILISDVHPLPGSGEPRSACAPCSSSTAAPSGSPRRTSPSAHPRNGPPRWPRWPVCTATRWRRACWSATSTRGRRRPSSPPCATASATRGSWPGSGTTGPGGASGSTTGGTTPPPRAPHPRPR